jgi:hypothetical protein
MAFLSDELMAMMFYVDKVGQNTVSVWNIAAQTGY